MTAIPRITIPLADSVGDLFKSIQTTTGNFAGRTVKFLQNIPAHMHDRNVAIAVFLTANAAFFSIAHISANWLNKSLEKHVKTDEQKTFKYILLDWVVIGGSTALFNYSLAKAANYPLTHLAIAGCSIATIGARFFINRVDTSTEAIYVEKKAKTPGK